MSQHTPAPWNVVEHRGSNESGLLCSKANEGHLCYSGRGVQPSIGIRADLKSSSRLMGSCEGGHVCDFPIAHEGRDQALANAQLIAASPDLLAAAEKLLANDGSGDCWDLFELNAARRQLRAAIAKAKGETP